MHRWLIALAVVLLQLTRVPAAVADSIAVSGRVLESGGAPLAGVQVALRPYADRYGRDLILLGRLPEPPAAATDRSGQGGWFRLLAPGAGMWRIEVRAPGRLTMVHPLVGLVDDIVLEPLELPVDAGLEVTVADAQGRLRPGARVAGRPTEGAAGDQSTGWRPADRLGATGDSGSVRLARGGEEELRVRAWMPGAVESEAASSAGEPVALRLRPGRSREVEIRDADGEPRPGVVLRVGAGSWPAAATSAEGRAILTLAASAAVEPVDAADPEGWTTALKLPPPAAGAPSGSAGGGASAAVEVRLPRPFSIVGTVVDRATSEPIAGAMVWRAGAETSFAPSDRHGRYRLAAGHGDSAVVYAAAPGHLPASPAAGDGTGTLALIPAVTLAGTVVDPEGLPVADAPVQVRRQRRLPRSWRSPDSEASLAMTAGDGRWLHRLAAGPTYELRVDHPGFAPIEQTVPAGESRRDLTLSLRRGVALTGQVVDAAGNPVGGADIRLFESPLAGGVHIEIVYGERLADFDAVAEPDGHFAVRHLPPSRFDVEIRAAGFAPLRVPGVVVPGADGEGLDLGTLALEPGATVEGWVVDADGRPVEGAQVVLDPLASERARPGLRGVTVRGNLGPGAVTDRQGYFRFADLAAGERVFLNVSHPDFVTSRLAAIEPPTDEPLRVVLQRGARLFGEVVDVSGNPVAGAHVQGSSSQVGGAAVESLSIGFGGDTDDDGRFSLDRVAPGRVELQVGARGFSTWRGAETATTGGEVGPLHIVLEAEVVVEGRVFAADGQPAIGSVVTLGSPPVRSPFGGARTDTEGRYRLMAATAGDIAITARHPKLGSATGTMTARPGANRLDLTLSLRGTVSGRVVDAAGAPLAGARVLARWRDQQESRETAEFTADDGSFLFALRPGTIRLSASASGFADAAYPDELTVTDAPITGLELRLERGGEIVGRLLGLPRERLASAEVVAQSATGGISRTGAVDYDGRFRVPAVSPGEWAVTATVPVDGRRAEGRVVVRPGDAQANLDLEFTAGLTLRGIATLNGEPLAGAGVSLGGGSAGAPEASTTTTFDGRFGFEGLEAGSYVLRLFGSQAGTYRRHIDLTGDDEVRIDVVAFRVAGRVVSAGGEPLAHARVVLTRVDDGSPWWEQDRRVDETGDDGRFSLAGVEEGSYRLNVFATGRGSADLSLEVAGGDVEGLEIPIDEGLDLELVPSLWNGERPAAVAVTVIDGEGRAVIDGGGRLDADGRVRIAGVPAGTWVAVVVARGTAGSEVAVTVPGPPVPVLLPPATALWIAVPALAGSALPARATLVGADGARFVPPGTGGAPLFVYGGRLGFPALPPGTWTVEVVADDGRRWRGTATTAPGAPAELVLE